MFCKKCGKELEDNVRFCNYCGTEVGSNVVEFKGAFGDKEPENSESSEPQYKYEYVSPEQVSQKAVEEPVEKDVTINIAGHKINGRLIMKIAAIVAAACFFFPMFTVSCAGVNVGSVSMADLTFETEDTTQESYYDYYDSDEEENGTVGMIVFLLAPISAFCICMVKNEGKGCLSCSFGITDIVYVEAQSLCEVVETVQLQLFFQQTHNLSEKYLQ